MSSTRAAPFMTMSLVMAACLATTLAACNPEPTVPGPAPVEETAAPEAQVIQAQVIQAQYSCANGQTLQVAFDNPRELAIVTGPDGVAHDLPQQRSADGFWYGANGFDLRGRGDEATWTVSGAAPTVCQSVD